MSNRDRINLLAILEAIDKIEQHVALFRNADEFNADTTHFDAAMMNFVIIGEMVARISTNCKETNRQIEWERIKSFRNLIAHDYFGIDAEEVWQIATTDLLELKTEIQGIIKRLDQI